VISTSLFRKAALLAAISFLPLSLVGGVLAHFSLGRHYYSYSDYSSARYVVEFLLLPSYMLTWLDAGRDAMLYGVVVQWTLTLVGQYLWYLLVTFDVLLTVRFLRKRKKEPFGFTADSETLGQSAFAKAASLGAIAYAPITYLGVILGESSVATADRYVGKFLLLPPTLLKLVVDDTLQLSGAVLWALVVIGQFFWCSLLTCCVVFVSRLLHARWRSHLTATGTTRKGGARPSP
jgi:hypothetical protein